MRNQKQKKQTKNPHKQKNTKFIDTENRLLGGGRNKREVSTGKSKKRKCKKKN